MVKRQTTYKADSKDIQGEGSWVELSYLTYGEFQAVIKDELTADAVLEEHVLAWNWVDGEGTPMGTPQESMGDLFAHERAFLLDCLYQPDENVLKN